MNNLPRQKLCELIRKYGESLCDQPSRCEGLLRDFCPGSRREIHVLMNALKGRVATELRDSSVSVPIELTLARLTKRLHDEQALSKDAARWAAESWGLALGKISEQDIHLTPAESTAAPSAPTPPTRDRPTVAARGENPSAQPMSATAPAASAQESRLSSRSFRLVYAVLALALVTGGGVVWYYVGTARDKALFTLKGHSGMVWSVAFSPDGRRIVTGSLDNTAKVWDAQSGKELTFKGHSEAIWSVAFSPDGTRVVTGSEDGKARVWRADNR